MGRIADAFARTKEEGRASLVIYLCAGDPELSVTPDLILAAAEGGADVLELGVPFSDPSADGEAIQKASERALAAGATLPGVLDVVRQVRARGCEIPILLFGYYNPIFSYGEDKLAADAASAGVDGFLVVDLPAEEAASLRSKAVDAGLDYVPLVAPTSTDDRIAMAKDLATAFVYYVSMTGITGAQASKLDTAAERAAELSKHMERPVAVGFGVKTPEDAATVARQADGVVVGSAIVRAIQAAPDPDAACAAVSTLVASLAGGVARARA
ncbi:MAG: tryptophan synthase subunit alpha [Myxococcota bacterium]